MIADTLTHSDAILRRAVDYVTGFLVNDSFAIIEKLITHFSGSATERQRLLVEMEVWKRYLTYGFNKGVVEKIPCTAHDIRYGLGEDRTAPENLCDSCRNLFCCFHYLKGKNDGSGFDAAQSAIKALIGCEEKAMLYMGHRMRVTNQQMSIQKIFDHMKDECVNNGKKLCVITLDYKMKLDPLYFREKTVDHYGKRGMSWHGSMVQYYTIENFEETSAPFLNKLYLDHIVDNENKQDKLAIISILEAVILAIRKHLPNIDQIILQSDNVGCYQNTMLMFLIPYLSYAHGIEISRIIHTETQDGKSVLDAHFARSMQHIISLCKEGNYVMCGLIVKPNNIIFSERSQLRHSCSSCCCSQSEWRIA